MVSRSSGKRSIKQSMKRAKKRAKRGSSAASASPISAQSDRKAGGKTLKKRGKPKHAQEVTVATPQGSVAVETLSPRQKLILERTAAERRKKTIAFVVTVCLGCAFIGALTALLVKPELGLAVGGALMCLILSFKFQRLALYAFIIYLPFSGTVTYALGGNAVLQVAKDMFYIPALIGVFRFCRKNRLPMILPQAIKTPLIFLILVVSLTILFSNLPDQIASGSRSYPMLMAALGVKILFGYIPLVSCIYYLIRKKEDMVFLLRLQAVLILVASALGLVQFFMLKTGMCAGTTGVGEEMFRASLDARCFVGGSLLYAPQVGQIRLPGTFVAPWQWGWFLISGAFFSFGTTFSDKSPLWRTVGLLSLVAVMVMAVVSGQRIALALVPVTVGILTVMTGQVANLKRFVPIGVVFGLILAYLVATNPAVVQARMDSLVSRWEASPPHMFILEQFEQVWRKQEGIFGHGVGRATNSARDFGKTTLLETYHPKLIYEIGPIGLIAVLALYTALTVATFRAYRATKDKNLRSYAASMWVFVLFISYCPYYYPLDVDPVAVYYWLAAGVVLKIPELERLEKEKAEEALAHASGVPIPKATNRRRKALPTFN